MGTLRTSEEGAVAAGEGRKAEAVDKDRPVDGGAKIIISAGTAAESGPLPVASAPPVARRTATPAAPVAAPKRGGAGLVVLLYLLAASALGYAIYERYFM